jgi:hypothetical protein
LSEDILTIATPIQTRVRFSAQAAESLTLDRVLITHPVDFQRMALKTSLWAVQTGRL